ncbi:MAG: secondary thiamine-phosphate synthase enzyme YjbQ [Nanoarchaeota archaeon]
MQTTIVLSTTKKQEIIDITGKIREIVSSLNIKEGLCNVYTQHTTTSITVNENYDPNICIDFLAALEKLIPSGKWKHDKVDNNADAHIKAGIVGSSITVPIKDSNLLLGQWQAIMFCEFDGPRENRKIVITVI